MLLIIKLKLFLSYSIKILVILDLSYAIYLLIILNIYFVFYMMRFFFSKQELFNKVFETFALF